MSELLDDSNLMKEKRGTTLMVLAILSWIWIGFTVITMFISIADGKKSAEELEEEKVRILETATPEVIEVFGEDYITNTLSILEISNEYFYTIQFLNLANIGIGFLAVYMMYKLRKKGFYLYILYSLLPIVITLIFFETGFLINFGIIFNAIFAILFCSLYGAQVKRMS